MKTAKLILPVTVLFLFAIRCVNAGTLSRIYIAPQDFGLLSSKQMVLGVIGEDADGNLIDPGPVAWSVNPTVGTMGSGGFTAGNTPGKYPAAVTATTADGLTATANVEVYGNQTQNGYMLERSFGSIYGGMFNSPADVAVDSYGYINVVNRSANAIIKVDSAGRYLSQANISPAIGENVSLAVAPDGNYFLADLDAGVIRKYSVSGSLVTQWGTPGTGNGQFDHLSDIAIDSSGQIYACDTGNLRIQLFNSSGGFIKAWTTLVGINHAGPPVALATGVDGTVWAAVCSPDGWEHIQNFNSQGTTLSDYCIIADFYRATTYYSGNPNRVFLSAVSNGCVYVGQRNSIVKYELDYGWFYELAAWGYWGRESSQFDGLGGIAIDQNGKIYASDSGNNRVQVFDTNGLLQASWYSSGSRFGQFNSPSGMAIDDKGYMYVADVGNRRVQWISPSPHFISYFASAQQNDSTFCLPGGLSLDPSGNIIVADPIGNSLFRFNYGEFLINRWPFPISNASPLGTAFSSTEGVYYALDGTGNCAYRYSPMGYYLGSWLSAGTGNGQVKTPAAITFDANGNRYISDCENNRIQKFSGSDFVASWGTTGTGNGQFQGPAGLCPDPYGNLYVADSQNCRIQMLGPTGSCVAQWGTKGYGPLNFLYPESVALDKLGNLYVADTGNHRVMKFAKVIQYPSMMIYTPTTSPTCTATRSPLAVGGTASNGIVSLTWSNNRGGSGNCVGSMQWNADIPTQPGSNILTITARDINGAVVTDTLTVNSYAPYPTITAPTLADVYPTNSSVINLAGTVIAAGTTTAVTWTNDRGGSGTCTGTTSWSASGIPLQSGRNVITIAAKNNYSYYGYDSITINYTPGSPITITDLKSSADDSSCYIAGATVSAVFGDCFYVQTDDRMSGIKVVPSNPLGSLTPGSKVDIAGALHTTLGCERYVKGTVKLAN